MTTKFLRRGWSRYSKLGRKRKKIQKWRKPKGRDNKMREKLRGYPAVVSIGYRSLKKQRNTINDKKIVVVNNMKELIHAHKNNYSIIIGKIGKKSKIEMLNYAKENNIPALNININKFLKKNKLKGKKENKNENKNSHDKK